MSETEFLVNYIFKGVNITQTYNSIGDFTTFQTKIMRVMRMNTSSSDWVPMAKELNDMFEELKHYGESKGLSYCRPLNLNKIWKNGSLDYKQKVWVRNIIYFTRKGVIDRSICYFTDKLSPDIQLINDIQAYSCTIKGYCPVCDKKADKYCKICCQGYCGVDHQKEDWLVHKNHCKTT